MQGINHREVRLGQLSDLFQVLWPPGIGKKIMITDK